MKHDKVKIASTPEHYKKYGVTPGIIEMHEDGARINGEPGNYEWWYFDANFEDGSNLVITFQTKPFTSSFLPLSPMVSVDFNGADGKTISKIYNGSVSEYSSSKERCDIKISKNEFKGDLKNYTIHIEIEELAVEVALTGIIPSWRPEAGVVLYGLDEKVEYGWLVAVPKGKVNAEIAVNGEKKIYSGYGYHDHNWGNKSLVELKHHGYWGRAEVDGYTFINAVNYAPVEYDKQDFIMFMLADEKKIIADDSSKVTFSASEEFLDEATGKPIARKISYLYEADDKKYKISYEIEKTIFRVQMLDALPEEQRASAMKRGFNPAYLRFKGSVILEVIEKNQVIEAHKGNAIWESMYFGNPEEV